MSVISQSTFPPNEFWDFSIRLYGKPEVAEACLALQDRHGVNVNLLLLCCWLAASGRGAFEGDELAQTLAAVADWRDNVVLSLRTARRYLKGSVGTAERHLADNIRRVVAETEIHAEHVEQLMLSAAIARPGTGTFDVSAQAATAADNLKAYLAECGVEPAADDAAALRTIVAGAFPDLPEDAAAALFAG
jgi:uncharacterized protein (TIGR02444 family)